MLLAGTTTPADASKHRHGAGNAARHDVARAHSAASTPAPAATSASGVSMDARWSSPAFLRSWLVAAALALVGAGAGWFYSHRDRRRLRVTEWQWHQQVTRLRSELAADHAEMAQLRAQLAAAQGVLADAERRRERAAANSVRDTDNQYRFIEAVDLRRKRLLNPKEEKTFKACLAFVRGRRLKACPQVSMGEMIRTADEGRDADNAFSSFNSKRVDMLICDENWRPLIAVEHQGGGHYQGNAEERDRVKRLALEQAGIGLVETHDDEDHAAILAALEQELARIGA